MKTLFLALASLSACVTDADLGTAESDVVNGDAVSPDNSGIVYISTPRYSCSGILLDNRFVLTAAHCTESELDMAHGLRGQAFFNYSAQAITARAVAVDPAGHEILGGTSGGKFFVARTRNDGSGQLDPYFGPGGRILTDIANSSDEGITALTVDPQGRIVAVGTATSGIYRVVALARYLADGTLDSRFGNGGTILAHIPYSVSDTPAGIAVDAYGHIYVAATAQLATKQVTVMRFRSDGILDTTFDGDGVRISDVDPTYDQNVTGLALDTSGRPVVVGSSTRGAAFVERFTNAGPPDASFAGDGVAFVRRGSFWTQANAIAIDASGRIVVAGESSDTYGMLAARLTASGALDTTFSGDGFATVTPFAGYSDAVAASVAIDSQGRIVLGGTATENQNSTWQFAAARILATGASDKSFDIDGMAASWAVDGYNNAYEAIGVGVAVAANDDVVVGFRELSATEGAGTVRFNGSQMVTNAPSDVTLKMGAQSRGATTVFRNPSLDAALFELAAPLAMNGNSTTYQFQGFHELAPSTLVGKTVDCYGYGVYTQTSGGGTLRHAKLPVSSATSQHFRVGVNSRDQSLWHGDSGGPCFYDNGTKWVVAGIASRGVFDNYLEEVAGSAFSEWTAWIRTFY